MEKKMDNEIETTSMVEAPRLGLMEGLWSNLTSKDKRGFGHRGDYLAPSPQEIWTPRVPYDSPWDCSSGRMSGVDATKVHCL